MNVCLCCGTKGQPGKWSENIYGEMQVCKKCYNTDPSIAVELIEVDDNIADIVIMLNHNGYKTLHSCEGHLFKNNNMISVNEGYLSFEDPNRTLEEAFKFLPDKIGKYELTYEMVTGPKSFQERNFINKFVLRFVREDYNEVSFWDYQKDKVHFFEELEKEIKQNIKKI